MFNNLNPLYLNDLVAHKEIDYELKDKNKVEQPKFSTKRFGYESFIYHGLLYHITKWLMF